MTIIRSPIELTPSREYIASRSRITWIGATITMAVFTGVYVFAAQQRGDLPGKTLAVAIGISIAVIAIVYFVTMSAVRRWSVVLKPDGSIDVNERTIRTSADDFIDIEQSPDGKTWIVCEQSSRKTLVRIPVQAFPDLLSSWNTMRSI